MAHRLARAFGTSPEMWLGLQQDVDLWDTHKARRALHEKWFLQLFDSSQRSLRISVISALNISRD
jgi:plasmid maintenance system antidote protein VapI